VSDTHGSRIEETERLFWTVMKRLEAVALEQYRRFAPNLATLPKVELVESIGAAAPGDAISDADLSKGLDEVIANARGKDEDATLMLQGLLLERLGRTIYAVLHARENISEATRAMAERAAEVSDRIAEFAAERLKVKYPDGDKLFQFFQDSTGNLFRSLDGISAGIDRAFGQRFGITFADLIGEYTADILPTLASLGMNRRKVVCHLTGSFMGM
jgi:hypothetical protein